MKAVEVKRPGFYWFKRNGPGAEWSIVEVELDINGVPIFYFMGSHYEVRAENIVGTFHERIEREEGKVSTALELVIQAVERVDELLGPLENDSATVICDRAKLETVDVMLRTVRALLEVE